MCPFFGHNMIPQVALQIHIVVKHYVIELYNYIVFPHVLMMKMFRLLLVHKISWKDVLHKKSVYI